MTSKERINTALSHRQPNRIPFFEYVLMSPIADAILGRDYIDFCGDYGTWEKCASEVGWEQALRIHARDQVELAERLGHDMIYVVPNPLPPDEPSKVFDDEHQVSGGDPVEMMEDRNKWRERKLENPLDERCLLIYVFLKEEMERRGMELDIFAPAYDHGVWTDIDLMQTMLLDPEVAHEHFRLSTVSSLRYIEKYSELGIRHIGVGGDFAGNRPIISPESYREFIMPEIRKLSDFIHSFGAWSVNASDGNLWGVIEDFLIGTNVDSYMEIDMNAGMDLGRLKKAYGDRITFYGNMDCGTILSFASKEEIVKYTIECIEAGSSNGGHIFTCSNAITQSVPLGSYLAMVNAYRGYFGLSEVKL